MCEANGDGAWVHVATIDALPIGSVTQVGVNGQPVALYNVAGTIYATSDICTHSQAYLSEGYLEGDMIECPLHQGTFHVPTGRAVGPPVTDDLPTYAVRTTDGAVFVKPNTSAPASH